MTYASVVDEIKQKIDIVELVGSYVSLKRAGKYYKANCPFHQEKTPSFVVSPDIGRWHCFGACHEGGDMFNFVMKWENITFAEALRMLAERAGVVLPERSHMVGYHDEEIDKKEKIFSINELAMRYYHHIFMHTPIGESARIYVSAREISSKIVETFGLGYAPEGWTNLVDYLKNKGITQEDIEMTGLAVAGSKGMYDRFRGRLMFPLKNNRGQVLGFSGRLIKSNPTEKDGGKYINTPETLVYRKRETLFGFVHSKEEIKKTNTAIIVEGEFDMIVPYEKGVANVVAIKGSALTREQLQMLRRYCDRLVLALDNDSAGFDALKKATHDSEELGFDVYVCVIPGGKDPDEAVRKDTIAFKAALEQAPPVYDYLIEKLASSMHGDDSYAKSRFVREVGSYIDAIKNPIVRGHYVQKIATMLHTSPESVTAAILDGKKSRSAPQRLPTASGSTDRSGAERSVALAMKFLALLVGGVLPAETAQVICSQVQPEDVPEGAYRALYVSYVQYHTASSSLAISFSASLSPELKAVFDELYMFASTLDPAETPYVLRLGLELRKTRINKTIQQLATATTEGADTVLAQLAKDRIAVEKQLAML